MISAAQPVEADCSDMDVLLSGIHSRFGYDFSHYSKASLKRRLDRACSSNQVPTYSALLDKLCADERSFDAFLKNMSVCVTEMFRDPAVHRTLRERIVPILKTYPFIKIWHAGCATGEEVYSMAILLHEEGFLEHARIYATDFSRHALEVAQQGIYPLRNAERDAANYQAAGGTGLLQDYCSAGYDFVKFKNHLKERITFSYHNLVTDGVFGEMNLILCRNVMIYFDRVLQNQVLEKFLGSLCHGGFLCLGNKETLNFTSVRTQFEVFDAQHRLYRKGSSIRA